MRAACLYVLIGWVGIQCQCALAQPVAVSVRLDTNQLVAGQSTTLRVLAQVEPSIRPNADRIFFWFVDVLNTNGLVAGAGYAGMIKAASDNDPMVSSTGVAEGSNRRGIYDSFLSLPGAGVANPVELMAIPVTALSAGTTLFRVEAGSGDSGLEDDMIVAPVGGGDPWTGGDYSAATAVLTVISVSNIELRIVPLNGGGPEETFSLSFTPRPGFDHAVEFRNDLGPGTWLTLPGSPHNSGTLTVTNSFPQRFFRVRAVAQ